MTAAPGPATMFPPRPQTELPNGLSEAELRAFLESVRVTDGLPNELRGYCRQDFWRFVRTLALVRGLRGKCLELGANPYFTTALLREFTDLELVLANYFGPPDEEGGGQPRPGGPVLEQTVVHRDLASGRTVETMVPFHHFNMEEERFPFEDGEFDVVLFCEILEHLVRDPLAALREIGRVLRPDGVLVLTTPNANRLENVVKMVAGVNVYDPYSAHGPYGRHNREYNKHELGLLLTYAGFEIDSMQTADVYESAVGDYLDWAPLAPLLRHRELDLGQYLFVRAYNRGLGGTKRPQFLFRSYPEDEVEPVNPAEPIDVERLVAELKERVANERAAGRYADDLSQVELEPVASRPSPDGIVQGVDLAQGGPRVRFRPELGFSSKPVIGRLITLVKRLFLRLLFHVFDDLARQTDAAIGRVEAALAVEVAARQRVETELQRLAGETERLEARGQALEARGQALEARGQAETGVREHVQRDVKALAERLGGIAERLDHLQPEARLNRLERGVRGAPTDGARKSGAMETATELPSGLDYLFFEARFRPSDSVRERQAQYVELLRDRTRVVDLGCGGGELVELLGESGVSAYGVEIEPDFIELLRDKGLEVVPEDALEHLRRLEPGAVDGIVASHLIEHLPAAALAGLVTLSAEKLADGGILVLETPNPESLVAGSINFHRDLTHVRPIHPDTLVFLCESAGFSEVEVRRLSPVPENERLPLPGDKRVDEVVGRLNDLIYGYQDYAVVARR